MKGIDFDLSICKRTDRTPGSVEGKDLIVFTMFWG